MQFMPSQKKESDMGRTAWSQNMSYKNFVTMLSEDQRKAYLKEIGVETDDTATE